MALRGHGNLEAPIGSKFSVKQGSTPSKFCRILSPYASCQVSVNFSRRLDLVNPRRSSSHAVHALWLAFPTAPESDRDLDTIAPSQVPRNLDDLRSDCNAMPPIRAGKPGLNL